MVKLTPDLVLGAAQYLNPCRDRELDLRGEYKWSVFDLGCLNNRLRVDQKRSE